MRRFVAVAAVLLALIAAWSLWKTSRGVPEVPDDEQIFVELLGDFHADRQGLTRVEYLRLGGTEEEFTRCDTNGDGRVDSKEFMAAFAREMPQQQHEVYPMAGASVPDRKIELGSARPLAEKTPRSRARAW